MEAKLSRASLAMMRYAKGEDRAFGEVYDELGPKLTRYLQRTVRDPGATDDLLQQVFMQIHLSRGRFAVGSRVEPWAYTIARAVAMEWLRRAYRRPTEELKQDVAADDDDPTLGLAAGELTEALKTELLGLSPKLREVFLLVRIDGLSHAEAAEILGIEESATKVRAHRATIWLRDKLARFRPKEDPG